jgi:hypothetical protein
LELAEHLWFPRVFTAVFPRFEETTMDLHDQELLDKQLRIISQPARQPGIVAMAIIAVFLVGMIAGVMLADTTDSQIAANGPAVAFLDTGAPITRN